MSRLTAALALACLLVSGLAIADTEAAPEGVKITGPHNPFTLLMPIDWKARPFDSLVVQGDEQTERAVYVFGNKMLPTDNFDLWWTPAEEPSIATGCASIHRVVLPEPMTPDALPGLLEKDPRKPPDTKGEMMQLGKYKALVARANLQGFIMSSVTIVNGNVLYLGFINGPEPLVAPQMPAFIKIMSTLEAPDVTPTPVEVPAQ